MAITGMKGNKDNSGRKFSGGGRRPDHNGINRKEAKERDEKRSKLTAKEQLSVLDIRCGKDQGASKERARLLRQLEIASSKPVSVASEVEKTGPVKQKAKDRRQVERSASRAK